MNNAFEDAFQRVFSTPTEKVQNKHLKDRLKSTAPTPPLSAEANERPYTTYSEQPQGERHE